MKTICRPLTEEGKEMGAYYGNAITQIYGELPIRLGLYNMQAPDSASRVSQFIKDCIVTGYSVGLGVYGSISHAVTLWGIDYNEETQMIEKMYLTDSDDIYLTGRDVPTLFEAECRKLEVELAKKEGGSVILEQLGISCKRSGIDWYDDTVYVGVVNTLMTDRSAVPEPATATLGLLGLAVLCARRRRSAA